VVVGSLFLSLLAQSPPAPTSAAWTLRLNEVPTAIARATLEPGKFTWAVETPFARNAPREAVVKVDAQGTDARGRFPEGLWFMRRPAPGCVKGFDEVTGREGELCMEPDGRGTALGEKFSGAWGADGILETLFIRGVQWKRGEAAWNGKNPWVAGFAVTGEGQALVVEGDYRFSVAEKNPKSVGKRGAKGDCMTLARAFIEQAPKGKYEPVFGLAVEGDKVWPHVWVRTQSDRVHLEPSVPAGETADRTYVELLARQAPQLYLDLLAGKTRVVRKAASP
jgi:hypothetical protein